MGYLGKEGGGMIGSRPTMVISWRQDEQLTAKIGRKEVCDLLADDYGHSGLGAVEAALERVAAIMGLDVVHRHQD